MDHSSRALAIAFGAILALGGGHRGRRVVGGVVGHELGKK